MAMNYRDRGKEGLMKNRNFEDITDLYGGAEKRMAEAAKGAVNEINLDLLLESRMNHFRALQGEELEEFIASIKSHGILTPITVRPVENGKYEILAGHNRVRGAKAAGLTTIPAIVKDVDDVEASIIIADTNLQREVVSDLEKGWAYRNIFEAINRKGNNQYSNNASGHADQKQVEDALGQRDPKLEDELCGQNDPKVRSSEIIAEKYGIGEKTVRRKIRLTYLLPALYQCYEEKLITQEVAEQLSYLRLPEMALMEGLLHAGMNVTPEIAKEIRKASEESEDAISDIDMQRIAKQVIEQDIPKKSRPRRYRIDDALFPETVKKGLREDYIVKALEYIRDNGIEIEVE